MTEQAPLSAGEPVRPPDVSVVIPTHDRWPVVTRALRSALGQRGVEVEVIVVDDGSRDGTSAQLGVHPDPRVRLVRLPSSQGGAGARNAGIAEARGRWVAFLDDDDVWSPDKLRLQLEQAAIAGAGFVYARAVHLREPGIVVRMHALPDPSELRSLILQVNAIPAGASNVTVETRLLRQLGGFDEGLDHLTDWDLWIRLAHATSGAACDEVLVGYVEHTRNRYRLAGREVAEEYRYLIDKHAAAAEAAGVRFDGPYFARGVALGYLHAGMRIRAAGTYIASGVRHRSLANAVRAPVALMGERFRARFAQDTRRAVRDIAWLGDVWDQHGALEAAPGPVTADPGR